MNVERADRRLVRLTHRLSAVAAAGILTALVAAPLAAAPSYADPGDPATPKQAFTIDDERITESSGLAASTKHPGYFYTNNDSGDTARVFALDPRGNVVGTIVLGSAGHLDWEALASGPDQRIWIGDIGDNEKLRGYVTLYRFREPESLGDQSVEWSRFRLEYPDGPHDAEALLVHPRTGRVYIVTKSPGGGAIYEAPPELAAGTTVELTKVASAPAIVTDGVFSPDGSAIVLRTYADAEVLSWPDAKVVRKIPLTQQRQGESVTMSLDGKQIFAGSEGVRSTVYDVPFTAGTPAGAPGQGPAPKPTTAKPTAKATAPASDEAADTNEGADGGLLNGLPAGILLLVIVAAVVAGIAAYPASRRRRPVRRRPPDDGAPSGSGGQEASPYDDPRGARSPVAGVEGLQADPNGRVAGQTWANEHWATPAASAGPSAPAGGEETWAGSSVAPPVATPWDEPPVGGRRRAGGGDEAVPLPWEDEDWRSTGREPGPSHEPERQRPPADQPAQAARPSVPPWPESPARPEGQRVDGWRSDEQGTEEWRPQERRPEEQWSGEQNPEEQWPPLAQWPPAPSQGRRRAPAPAPAPAEPLWPDEDDAPGRRRSENRTPEEPAYDNGSTASQHRAVSEDANPAPEPPAPPVRRGRRIRQPEDLPPAEPRPRSPRESEPGLDEEEPPWAAARARRQADRFDEDADRPPTTPPERPKRARRPLFRDEDTD